MNRLPPSHAFLAFARRMCSMAFVLLACATATACDRSPTITFGVVLDVDGLRGATIAMEEINARGGIDGHPLTLRSAGGAGSTKASVALETAAALAADPEILGIIGHTNSSASLAASQIYNARHIVHVAPTTTSPLFTHAGPYSFRLAGSDVHQSVFLANHVLSLTPRPRIAVLFVNDDYGRPLHQDLVARLRAGGGAPVYDAPYGEGASVADNTEMVDALSRAAPELLVWIGRSAEFVKVRDTLRKVLPALAVLGSDGFSGSTVTNDTLHTLDGVSYVRLVDAERPDSALRRLYARYLREGWREPSDQAVLSYDAVLLLAEAVRAAGPDREAIRAWMTRVGADIPPVQGLSGPIAFSADGDRLPQYFLETIGKARLSVAGRTR